MELFHSRAALAHRLKNDNDLLSSSDVDSYESEPTVREIVGGLCHPSLLIPDALINASTGIVGATAYVFALQINNLVKKYIDENSHNDLILAMVFSFFGYLIASYIGSIFIQLGKKLKRDIKRNIKKRSFKG